jgi:lipid II:glycine glycyltransferase (peptidoglycan interpeptide bridge formation enzyme)
MDAAAWNSLIASLPNPHILQTWEWGQVKARYGWQVLPQTWRDNQGRVTAAALVLQRAVSVLGGLIRLRILYVPKGPLLEWGDADLRHRVLKDLSDLARQQGAIFIKIDPDVILGEGFPGQPGAQELDMGLAIQSDLQAAGWHFSEEQVQFRNTVLIDLHTTEDELLARMKQKTRYNIRLAERKGVKMRIGDGSDLEPLYRLYAETSLRDGFVIRDEAYYRTVWDTFMQAGLAEPLIAELHEPGAPPELLAALVLFHFAGSAWYLYGMSSERHRQVMPNHLLQWEAIRRAKVAGCQVYDLWGAPDHFDESDRLWGVYRFKEGLGGSVIRTLGAWDLPAQPLMYSFYTQVLPRLLDVMRRRGKSRTRDQLLN